MPRPGALLPLDYAFTKLPSRGSREHTLRYIQSGDGAAPVRAVQRGQQRPRGREVRVRSARSNRVLYSADRGRSNLLAKYFLRIIKICL